MNLAELRKTMPSLSGLNDQDAVDVIHQVYYPTRDKAEISQVLGVTPPGAPPAPQAGVIRTAGDVGVKLAQGAVDLGAAAVGLGSLASGGLVGKGMRAIGYDPKRTNEVLGEYLSDSQKASDQKVAQADGFVDTVAASVQNPRAILGTIAQSAPGMLAGMGVQAAVARGIAAKAALATGEGAAASAAQLAAGKGAAEATKAALATTAGKSAAGAALDQAGGKLLAIGAGVEGAQSAGSIADGAQAAGRDYTDYALPAIAAGVGTAAIGLASGKLLGDSATQIATGSRAAGVKGGLGARVGKEFFSEGVLEEMPQSAQEQIFTNIANGEQDELKGVGNAAGTGLITGGVMGAGMGAMQHNNQAPTPLPNTGPLSQAANAGQAAAAAQANAMAPQGTPASAAPTLAQIDDRMAELVALGIGQLAGRTRDANGNMVAVPAIAGRQLTAEEAAEYNALKQARAAATAIPADQQAEYQAALAEEAAQQNAKHVAAMQASAQARDAAETQQIAAMVAEDEARKRQAEQEAEREQIAATNAMVQQGDARRAAANRAALRADVLNDGGIPHAEKPAAYRRALAADGYLDNQLNIEDRRIFKEAAQLHAATPEPLPSAPNELVDAVPERLTPAPAPAAADTNTVAVDEAIAAGMRLKTVNGKVLHKPGSSKVFTLSTAQKAHYLAAMERAQNGETSQQNAPSVEEAAVAEAEALAPVAQDADAPAPGPAVESAPTAEFDLAAHEAATSPHNDLPEPTAAQKEAGNYKLGKARMQGLDLSIENPAGSTRKGVDKDGTPWENTMAHHYGYLRGTVGADKDHIDAFIGPNRDSDKVFVIDQVDPVTRKFDEHKVMLGFDSPMEAQAAYRANYADDWKGGHHITTTSMDGFKAWLAGGKTKHPFVKSLPRGTVESMEDAEARFHLQGLPADKVVGMVRGEAVWRQQFPDTYGPVDPPAPPAPPAPAPTKQQLNKMTVKDMSDAQLLQARDVLAGTARAPKIDKEIATRGLDAATPAPAPAPQAAEPGMLANATAPEHIQTGVDERELGQIVAEFNDAQAEMMAGEHTVSNVFQPPKKGEVVRLAEKSKGKLWNPAEVKAYNQQLAERDALIEAGEQAPQTLSTAIADFEAVYLPHIAKLKTEAAAEIGAWRQHARAQGTDPATRAANGRKIVLSLFDLSGEWSKPWEEAGYQVYRFDIQDDAQVGDVNNFSSEFFSDWFGDFDGLDVYAILAATPCTDFAVSGARHFAAKDKDGRTVASVKLVHQTLRTIEYFKPSIWALENPVGRIESLGGLPPWRLSFDPNHLGDSYTKKTLLWGRFNGDLPVAPVEPTEGSKMHKLYGGKSMATKNARSVTPEGFSYGFFMANNAIDHPVMALANKYDRLDRNAIADALAAGVTEDQINDAVEDHYYMDMDDDAANEAVHELAHPTAEPELEPEPTRPDDAVAAVDKTGELPDTDNQITGQEDDSTNSSDTAAIDHDLADVGRSADVDDVAGRAEPARAVAGRADDGGLREPGGHPEGSHDGQQDVGNPDGPAAIPDRSNDPVAGSHGRVPAVDFHAPVGGLTREGSWHDTANRNIDLIELALRIEQEGRPATPQEQALLSKYVGFGAADIRNKLFPIPSDMAKRQEPERLLWPQFVAEPRWRALAERMEALPRAWQKSVLQSSQYAHYTSEGIIRSVWAAVQRMGFTGGKVFEPGMGIGSFAMLMPSDVRATSRYTGVEFDGPTATIARLLSPEQNMLHDDFIKRKFPRDYFDVAIGNPPFSQTKVFADPDYEKNGFMLHDFFFAKSIDRVRPGGLLAFVTSKGTMDKQTDKARKYLSERADLLGAIRLPSTAFEANAGTSVVTDVIFLRKRMAGESPAGQPWGKVQTIDTKDGPVVVNEYFASHPEMVLGQQRVSGNTDDAGRRIHSNGRGAAQYTVVSYDATPAELDLKFAAAIEHLPQRVYSALGQSDASVRRETAKVDFDPSVKRDGVVYIGDDGIVMRVESGVGRPLAESAKLTAADTAWFGGYVGLRDLVQETRLAQSTDGNWEASLKKLNKAYDAFRKEHGPINDYRIQVRKSTDEDGKVIETESKIFKNRRRYREDYDAAVLTQLETINEAGDIVKAPFLLGRTIGLPVTRDVKSIGDALAVSLDSTGKLDLDDIARRMGMGREEAIEGLGDQVFQTPDGQWQLADEYLSGDVVAKLEEAEQAARIDPALRRNVAALSAAQPEKLGPSQISAKLGSAWIPAAHVNDFAGEIEAGEVSFDPTTETWQVDGGNLRTGRRAGAEFGTAKRSPSELLEAVLNSRPLKVTMTTEDKKTVTDVEATTAANEAAKKIKDKFRSWIWTDAERAGELVESYNKRFNNIAPRRFDGSHLTLPGVSLRYSLHTHQKNGIWRQIQTGDTYLAHAVGAGKTIEMIAAGMEQKRLGLIKKPMYVVPNHMLEQFSNEFLELYPLANIMVADDENFSAERRRAFIASATLNNPDAVIITHDAFQRIGVKEESVAPIRDEILADLEIELSETAKGNDTRVRRSQLEQQIEAVGQRFDRIIAAGGKDSTIKFEDIGVDYIFADEAHVYRKLDFHTSQQIKGIDPNGSKRALDMYVKTRYLQQLRPGRAMTFASGTPITNTMGELYTIMRFFAPQELDRGGIATFDSWSRMFGEVAPALEPNAAGKYELVERFAKFDNVPELMSRVRQFMDVLTSEHLGALVKRPDLAGGKPHLNIVEPSDQLQAYMASELGPRIERSKRWKPTKEQPNNPDPIVAIITDGRFAALDPRFFGGKLEAGESSILTEMAAKVVATHHATANNVYLDKAGKPEPIKGSTQMVFYNLGFGEQSQANRGFNSRAAFTKLLVDGGIPRAQIAWFEDANTDAKKEVVFKGMRSGQIRVLIGSAKKMGTGVNAQKRLIKLHYQDPPWFPSDVEQPHGRIIRQGNQNDEVGIDWYTTKGTYQSTMWQMVGRKQRFIDQAFTGDKSLRSMDDLGEASLFEQAAAVASGDPRALQLAGLKQEVARLERLQAAHANEQIAVRNAMQGAEWAQQSATRAIDTNGAAFKVLGERHFAFAAGDVLGVSYDKPGEFGQALKDAFNATAARSEAGRKPLQDVKVAQLADGIALTMDSVVDSKGKKTGDMDLSIHIGDLTIAFSTAPSMGAQIDAAGFSRRVFNAINGVETDLRRARTELKDAETDLVRLRKKRGAPFEHQQELAEKYGDLQRLEEELRQEGVAASAAMGAQLDAQDAAAAAAVAASGEERAEEESGDTRFSRDADYFRDDGAFSPELIPAEDGAGDAAPGELPGRELIEARKDTERLNRNLIGQGIAPVRTLRAAPNAHYALARQVGRALGFKVHFVSANEDFQGVATNGVAFLAAGMRNPALAIAGHEVLHAMEQSNPEMGAQLRTRIRAYLKDGAVGNRQAREHIASGFQDVTEEAAEGEVLADINGAMWLDPQFWSDLAQADRSLFRTVAYKFMELAAKAIGALRSARFDVAQLVTDVDAVRAIMVSTWAQHARGVDRAAGSASASSFSREDGDTTAGLAAAKDADRQFAEAELQYGGREAYDAIKAAGATALSYPQWVMTKTPNFKQFYGDWEANNGAIDADRSVHAGVPRGGDAGRVHGGADAAAGSAPAFPGQSGPVRTTGGAAKSAAIEPAIYYHGTRDDVDAFDLSHAGRKDNGWLGTGVYATSDNWLAESYASLKQGEQGPNIMPLFMAVKNPFVATAQLKNRLKLASREKINEFTADLAARGYDGVVLNFADGSQELVAFNPAAAKSAVGNNGAFDAGNADLRFSRGNLAETLANAANAIQDVRLPASYLVGDLFNQSGKISWWHKTIGTMENLAKRQTAFRPVYEAVQDFLGDVSRYGVLAADQAPTLLPKLEDIADVIGKHRKKPLTAADTKAIGAPIFEGTLTWARDAHGDAVKVAELEAQAEKMTSAQKAQILIAKGVIDDAQNQAWLSSPLDFYDNVINKKFATTQLAAGVVWTDAELRALFHLNDGQIALYREFRAALDKSLTNLTISEMVKLGGKDALGTLDRAIAAPDLAAAAAQLRDHFVELARMHPQQADMHLDTAKQIMDLGDRGQDLMDRGYAPLSRFGQYTVYVQEDGEQVYFGMFETQHEASRMARRMRVDHPGADVTHGTVSEDAYKLFAGVSPETIELFGSMVGLDSQGDAASTEVYQAYLKMAKNNRSAMKRMIQRKGIAGFSEDAGRVLAGFIYSNARLTAGNAHLGEVDVAITAIPKQEGELTDAAMQLRESIRNPAGANKLGGLMFAQFLGGSVASAMVNLTQPLTMTLPYLSQYGGLAKAAKRLTAAVRDAAKDSTGEAHLDQALQWAADEGIVAPQEIHYLQAQASGKGALRSGDGTRAGDTRAALNNTMAKVQLGWGKLFSMAELANRRVTFIAAYRTAIEQGIADPAKFAEQSVSQTQGTYNSGNKPRWARGAIGGLLMTFKQYSIGYLELLTRMASAGEKGSKERAAGQRGALYMIAVLFLMAGADGLPFEQDIEDAIDGALQRLGYNFSTKRAKQEFLTDVLGEGGADFALKGISSMPGMPIDVAGRFGMGNLLPATGLLTKKESYTQDLGELAGPAGDVAKRAFSAAGKLLGGDIAGAALESSPAAVRNAAKGVDMLATGAYKDKRGYKINDVSATEGLMKVIGFQPNSTANIQDVKGQALNMIAQNRMRSTEIQEHWAQGIAAGDPDTVREARAWRDDWNDKNPETPIRVNLPAIYKRVRGMRQDAVNRTQKTAPAALKATVRAELQEVRANR